MMGFRLQLEDLPRFFDTAESELFALRIRLAGALGRRLHRVLTWPSMGLVIAFSPLGRATLLAALGTYLSADLLSRAAALPRALRGATLTR